MYLSKEDFISGVSQNFSPLKQFGFQELGFELSNSGRGYYYFYSANELSVRIHYSLTNKWIDVDFVYNDNQKNFVANQNKSLSLMLFLFDKGQKNYEENMPKSIGFTNSIVFVAHQTINECVPLLTGKLKVTDETILFKRKASNK